MFLMMHSKRHMHAVTEKWEMTPVQGMLLMIFEPDETKSMQGLSAVMGCDASNITGLVDRLEAQGLIERTVDSRDRRVKLIRLSKEGRDCRAKIVAGLSVAEAVDMKKLTVDEITALSNIIDKLIPRH